MYFICLSQSVLFVRSCCCNVFTCYCPSATWLSNYLTLLFNFGQVMLGVDRLDMIKGIPQKILAFEKFLEENPSWRDKVVLLQIAVPTRTDVPECMFMIKYVSILNLVL